MAKEIRWTPESVEAFDKVIVYLEEKWTKKEVENFINATEKVIVFISLNPLMLGV